MNLISFVLLVVYVSCERITTEKSVLAKCLVPHCYKMQDYLAVNIKIPERKGAYTSFCFEGYGYFHIWSVFSSCRLEVNKSKGYFKPSFFKSYWADTVEKTHTIWTSTSIWDKMYMTYRDFFIEDDQKEVFYYFNCETVSCLLIDTDGDFSAKFSVQKTELIYVVMFITGIMLFVTATPLASSTAGHYIVAAVVLAMTLVYFPAYFICFKLCSLQPKHVQIRRMLLGTVITTVLLLGILYSLPSWKYVFWYFALVFLCGIVSIQNAYIYQYLPIPQRRLKTFLTSAVRLVGIIFIFSGIQMVAYSVTVVAVLVASQQYLIYFLKRDVMNSSDEC